MADETRVGVVATAICHLCAARNPTTVGEGPVTIVGRDALVHRLGLATLEVHDAHVRYLQDRSGENSTMRWQGERERDTALAALRDFDKGGTDGTD